MLGAAPDSTTVTLEETQIISGGSIIVHGVTVENNGALGAIEVVFTNTAGTEILSIAVPANKTFHYKPSWVADNGLRITGLNDSGVKVTVKHNDDIAPLAAEAYTDTKALDFTTGERLRNTTLQSIGIADNWSIQVNYKPSNLGFQFALFTIGDTLTNTDTIQFDVRGDVANDPLRITLTKTDTTVIKEYDWASIHTIGVKISVIATWNGTDLKVYLDGVETAATTETTNVPGAQGDTDRGVAVAGRLIGATTFSGDIHSTSIWDTVLTQAEVSVLQNGGSPQNFDNRFNLGSYASANNLQHYWRCGGDASDIGRDFGNASTLIDVGDNAVNVTSADIVDY